jgi:hypothetical protein
MTALAMEVPGAGGTPWGTGDVEMVGAGPWPGGGTGILLQDLGTHITSVGVSVSAALGYVAPASWSSRTMSPGLPRSYLQGSPGSLSPPINWRRVESEAESMCSQVATAELLLHKALALVHRSILRPV